MATFAAASSCPADIMCTICRDPWDDPVELRPCGHVFCRACIGTLARCPDCRSAIGSRVTPSRILCNLALQAKVQCELCGWSGTREASRRHQCPLAPAPAPSAPSAPSAPPQQAAPPQQQQRRKKRGGLMGFLFGGTEPEDAPAPRPPPPAHQPSTTTSAPSAPTATPTTTTRSSAPPPVPLDDVVVAVAPERADSGGRRTTSYESRESHHPGSPGGVPPLKQSTARPPAASGTVPTPQEHGDAWMLELVQLYPQLEANVVLDICRSVPSGPTRPSEARSLLRQIGGSPKPHHSATGSRTVSPAAPEEDDIRDVEPSRPAAAAPRLVGERDAGRQQQVQAGPAHQNAAAAAVGSASRPAPPPPAAPPAAIPSLFDQVTRPALGVQPAATTTTAQPQRQHQQQPPPAAAAAVGVVHGGTATLGAPGLPMGFAELGAQQPAAPPPEPSEYERRVMENTARNFRFGASESTTAAVDDGRIDDLLQRFATKSDDEPLFIAKKVAVAIAPSSSSAPAGASNDAEDRSNGEDRRAEPPTASPPSTTAYASAPSDDTWDQPLVLGRAGSGGGGLGFGSAAVTDGPPHARHDEVTAGIHFGAASGSGDPVVEDRRPVWKEGEAERTAGGGGGDDFDDMLARFASSP